MVSVDRLLVGADGRVRAPWRLLAFALASIVSLVVLQAVAQPIVQKIVTVAGLRVSTQYWLLAAALLAGHALVLEWADRRQSWAGLLMGRAAWSPQRLAIGAAVGALAIGVPALLLLATGQLAVRDAAATESWGGAALRLAAVLAPAALWEELLFRGYAFTLLRESLGDAVALGATSVLFGAVHLSNPGADLRSTILVTLAGIFLGGVMLALGSLWAAWLAHLAWNWTMAALLHVPVSGLPFGAPGYRVVDAGPDWLTGGRWGPEGGVPAGLGMAAGLALLLVRRTDDARGGRWTFPKLRTLTLRPLVGREE